MWQFNSTNELYHFGVKGMKWGVRRKAKKELKNQYKEKKKQAALNRVDADNRTRNKYNKAVNRAESRYNKETAPAASRRDKALKKNEQEYSSLKKSTKQYYNSKIEKHMNKAEKHDKDADFWGQNSTFGTESRSKADSHVNKAAEYESRYNQAKAKNASDNESRIIQINAKYDSETKAAATRYANALDKASSTKRAEYASNGKAYADALQSAKIEYKQSVKNLR